MTYNIALLFFQAPLYLTFKLESITSLSTLFSFKIKETGSGGEQTVLTVRRRKIFTAKGNWSPSLQM